MSDTPLLGLPLLEASQAQKHVTHNEALLRRRRNPGWNMVTLDSDHL